MSKQITKALEDVAKKAGEGLATDFAGSYRKILTDTHKGATAVAETTAKKEAGTVEDLAALKRPKGASDVPKPSEPKPGPPPNAWNKPLQIKPSGSEVPKPTPPKLRNDAEDPKKTATPATKRTTKSDPVDIASGDMVLSAVDLALPGVLALVLSRTHVSSYRCGGWFGRSWASTLDQRLELDDAGVVFAAEDGMLLSYPVPQVGAEVVPTEGPRWPLRWDGAPGGTLRVTDPHTGTSWHFGAPSGAQGPHAREAGSLQLPLTAITDRNGNRIEILHTADGIPYEVRHTAGYRVAVATTGKRITALTLLDDRAGDGSVEEIPLVAFGYDGDGNLDAVTDSSGLPLRYTYDTSARITGWTNRAGHQYRYLYDRAGRCVQTRGDGGFLDAVFSYDTERRTTTVTDSLGHATVFELDEYGRTVRESAPNGAVAATSWDRYGRLLSRTDPLGAVTAFDYDADGNLTRSTLPDGTVSTAGYDDSHRMVDLVALDGTRWGYSYDERGNLTAKVDPLGARTTYAHGERGEPRSTTDPLGSRTQVSTNPAGLLLSVTDPLGAVTHCTRDAFGREVSVTDPLGGVTTYGWTIEGRPAWQVDAEGGRQEWTYDADGNLVEHLDASGARTRYAYTYFGRLAARTEHDGTRYTFTYDTQLQLTAVTNPAGARWTYRYDAVGALVAETDFTGRTITYTRDLTGQLVARTNGAGQSVTFTRDLRGRTVQLAAAEQTIRFGYDAAGRLLEADNGTGLLRYRYDAAGRTVAEEYDGAELTHGYDLSGQRVLRRTPAGVESRWTYDAAGQPTSLSTASGTLAFDYDALGRETVRRFGEAAVHRGWDAMDRLTGLSLTAGGQNVAQRSFGYQADGMPVGSTDSVHGPVAYQLDARARVTAVTGANWSERYAYDQLGNVSGGPTPVSGAGTGEPAAPAELDARGLLRTAGRTSYDYDGQGRIVRETRRLLSGGRLTWHYQWDSHDQLIQVTVPDGTLWCYRYDALGRRTAKRHLTADGASVLEETTFSWDGAHLAEQRHTRAGTAEHRTTTWDWSVGGQLALTQLDRLEHGLAQEEINRRFHAIVTDLAGAPTELVDESGVVSWRRRGTIWGRDSATGRESPQPVGPDDCPLRFPGQYLDRETGLHYNLFRYYDPTSARYLSPDPLGLSAADNPYGYVPNPLVGADPLGLDPEMVDLYHGTTRSGADNIVSRGINPNVSPRPMDFGHGGFYVTNDRRQAEQWSRMIGQRRGEDPAVLHFRVPKDQLDALPGRRFGPDDDAALGQFIRHHRADRNGTRMHGYDLVEGKMLMNMNSLRNRQIPMRLSGHQIAIHHQGGASLFDQSLVGIL
ncbi:DUF6531 domain-containing protein [Kitasatospora mediocidica]|uniref:DUF6531 domain-containing protein n=1 Tax=Kitasatospora mediocidica TaxID=58352 RepID=UPI00068A6E6C|nr:DUF6531 domain-containing protein [Kitasatospora mediocidica]